MKAREWVAYLAGVEEAQIPRLGDSMESRYAYAAIQLAEKTIRAEAEYWAMAAQMFPNDAQIRDMARERSGSEAKSE